MDAFFAAVAAADASSLALLPGALAMSTETHFGPLAAGTYRRR